MAASFLGRSGHARRPNVNWLHSIEGDRPGHEDPLAVSAGLPYAGIVPAHSGRGRANPQPRRSAHLWKSHRQLRSPSGRARRIGARPRRFILAAGCCRGCHRCPSGQSISGIPDANDRAKGRPRNVQRRIAPEPPSLLSGIRRTDQRRERRAAAKSTHGYRAFRERSDQHLFRQWLASPSSSGTQ